MIDCKPVKTPTDTNVKLIKNDGTMNFKLVYDGNRIDKGINQLCGYSDADWAGDINDRRSTSGYVFMMSNAAIIWSSQKQSSVALSTTEAEYMAISQAAREALWFQTLLKEISYSESEDQPITIHCDNQSCIALTKNPVYHSKAKHIDIRYHFIKENVKNGNIKVDFSGTDDMVADSLTKAVALEKFEFCRKMMGLMEL
jgi:hypothetical protein